MGAAIAEDERSSRGDRCAVSRRWPRATLEAGTSNRPHPTSLLDRRFCYKQTMIHFLIHNNTDTAGFWHFGGHESNICGCTVLLIGSCFSRICFFFSVGGGGSWGFSLCVGWDRSDETDETRNIEACVWCCRSCSIQNTWHPVTLATPHTLFVAGMA